MLSTRARILSVGTANPPERYTQEEILDRYRFTELWPDAVRAAKRAGVG